jgi:uncharacterized integral membrane protein (TIGR00698 family)
VQHLQYLSPLFLSLVGGLAVGNAGVSLLWAKPALDFAAKRFMRIGVALLGLQISFHTFADIGARGFLAILLISVLTFSGVRFAARRFGLGEEISMLIAGGFAICGASAIAAIGAARKSSSTAISYAIGMVTICGTLSIFVIPPITRALSLSHQSSGAWIGAAVHDVGQVIATAGLVGGTTIKYAVVSKLTRVVLLAPLLVYLTLEGRRGGSVGTKLSLKTLIPPFIAFFILFVAINNAFTLSTSTSNFFSLVSKIFLSAGIFAMATNVKFSALRTIGAKPFLFGISAWIICGALTLGILRAVGI